MELAAALAVFIGSHVAISRTAIKPFLIEKFGRSAYLAAYSLLSLVLFTWVITALLQTRIIQLWPTTDWGYGFALALTFFATLLLGAGAVSPNPFSVSFHEQGFDAARPGIVGFTRHPIVWGFGLWGLAHVPANGDVMALLVFGGVFAFALLGARSLDRRARQRLGEDTFKQMTASNGSLDRNAIVGGIAGALVWMGIVWMHPRLFGVDPLFPFK